MKLQAHFSHKALADASMIQDWTLAHFGEISSKRYDELLEKAVSDLLNNPACLGVSQHPALHESLLVYHLRFSRIKNSKTAVRNPRHFIVFRLEKNQLSVLRILHDSMDLTIHLLAEE